MSLVESVKRFFDMVVRGHNLMVERSMRDKFREENAGTRDEIEEALRYVRI